MNVPSTPSSSLPHPSRSNKQNKAQGSARSRVGEQGTVSIASGCGTANIASDSISEVTPAISIQVHSDSLSEVTLAISETASDSLSEVTLALG